MMLTLEFADRALAAARTHAAGIGISASIVLCDAAGYLKAFSRMDGAWLGSIEVAMRKAKTSVLFEAETQMLWAICRPDGQAHGLESTNGGLLTFAGGIPLRSPAGVLLGAVGVSGGQVPQDYEIAQAALAAVTSFAESSTRSK